jgi:outer membrane protein assembly factor BamB
VEAFRASSGQALWRTPLSSSSTLLFPPAPQVLAGIVYAQVDERATLFALRAGDGRVLWHQDADGSPVDTVRLLLATPGIAYLNAYHDPAGQILARRSSDGAVLWRYAPPSCFPVAGSLLGGRLFLSDSCQGVWDQTVAVQAESGQLLWRFSPGGYLTATRTVVYVTETADSSSGVDHVFAVETATGHLLWQRVSARGGAGEAHIWAATAEAVYATMHGIWYALAASDGRPVWQFPPAGSTELGPNEGTMLQQMQSWVVSGRVVYLFNGLLQALDARTGTLLWTFSAQSAEALGADPVALSAGIIYLSGVAQYGDAQAVVSDLRPQALIALEARSGKVLWHTIQTQQAQLVAPHGVYLSVAAGKPYHFTYRILALQPTTGKQMWTQQL